MKAKPVNIKKISKVPVGKKKTALNKNKAVKSTKNVVKNISKAHVGTKQPAKKSLPATMRVVENRKTSNVPSPLFMVAQLPFNKVETVKLNTPMIEIMNDEGNVHVATANLKELGIYEDLLKSDTCFLEIGCGSGYLLESLYKTGKGLYLGIEPIGTEAKKADLRLAEYLKSNAKRVASFFSKSKGAKKKLISTDLLEKAKFAEKSLSYIYSYHVFEHLENPLDMFACASKWLKSDGKLIITCPNIESMMAMRDLNSWRCSLSSHRWLPGKSTIIRAAERSGYKVVKVFTYGGHPAPRSLWKSFLNWTYKKMNLGDVICIMLQKK